MLLILLIIVLIILFINMMKSLKEGMKPRDQKTKKGLICYYGGAFREGGNLSSLQDTKNSYDGQYYATQTHLKLTENIKSKGYNVDTIINTYSSKYEKDLSKWYKPYEILLNRLNKNIESTDGRDNLIKNCIKSIKRLTPDDYDFILFIRIDLFLKPGFFNILDIESNKINFIANNSDAKNNCITHNKEKDPVVVDLFLFVPKKYFYILDNKFKLCHDSWTYYKKNYKLTENDMGFMINKVFDSNSYLDMNHYYLMVGRKENTKIHNSIEAWDYNYEKSLYNNEKCNSYDERNETYLKNPAEFYYNKHIKFYNTEK